MGDTLTYDNLTISFIVDEFLENYITVHDWLTGIGFPKNRAQFSEFRGSTSTTPTATQGSSSDIGDVSTPTASRSMFSDLTLTVLSNKNNPIVEVRFTDAYPVSLSALDFNQQAADAEFLTASVDFSYKLYEIVTLE